MIVIPNGIDAEPSHLMQQRTPRATRMAREYDGQLIGLVGRLDPVKDHRRF
jgi:hypothetical protein